MAKYLVTYHGGGPMPEDPAAAQEMMQAFGAWVASVGSAMVDPGAPLAVAKTVAPAGVTDGQGAASIEGYSLIEASDIDAAVALVESHPFVARGGTLEVSEAVNLG